VSDDGPEKVRDITPSGAVSDAPLPACDGCSLADVIERKEKEARAAAWAGVFAAILGTMSWTTIGIAAGAIAAFIFGLYARNFARRDSYGAMVGGSLALGVLVLRLAGLL
jgi:hypothetical protein